MTVLTRTMPLWRDEAAAPRVAGDSMKDPRSVCVPASPRLRVNREDLGQRMEEDEIAERIR